MDDLRAMRRELRTVEPLSAILVMTAVLFAVGTHIRNFAWRDASSLWLDIANKVNATRTFDPETGLEVPRMDRARIYNNIGLQLYYSARDLLEAEAYRKELAGNPATVAPRLKLSTEQLKAERKDTAMAIDRLRQRILDHIPEGIRGACQKRGITPDSDSWDPLIPAEIALEQALYHRQTYPLVHLNTGLIHRIRARYANSAEERTRHLKRAEESFRLAHTYDPTYAKAFRYHASALAELKEYDEAHYVARHALAAHTESEGDAALLETLRLLTSTAIELQKWPDVQHWASMLVRSDPEALNAVSNLYLFSLRMEERDAPLKVEETLLGTGIQHTGASSGWLRYRLADCLGRQGRTDEALHILEDLINGSDRPAAEFLKLRETLRAQGENGGSSAGE